MMVLMAMSAHYNANARRDDPNSLEERARRQRGSVLWIITDDPTRAADQRRPRCWPRRARAVWC